MLCVFLFCVMGGHVRWWNAVSTRPAERYEASCSSHWRDSICARTCDTPLYLLIGYKCPQPHFSLALEQWTNQIWNRVQQNFATCLFPVCQRACLLFPGHQVTATILLAGCVLLTSWVTSWSHHYVSLYMKKCTVQCTICKRLIEVHHLYTLN